MSSTTGKDGIVLKQSVSPRLPPQLLMRYWREYNITMPDADIIFGEIDTAAAWMACIVAGGDVSPAAVKANYAVATPISITGKTTALRKLIRLLSYVFQYADASSLLEISPTLHVPKVVVDANTYESCCKNVVLSLSITESNNVYDVVKYKDRSWLPTAVVDEHVVITQVIEEEKWRPRGEGIFFLTPLVITTDGHRYRLGEEVIAATTS